MARFDKLELNSRSQARQEATGAKRPVQDAAHWMQQADEQRRVGQYENALRYYSRALEDDKSLVGGWLGQVQMLIQLDECPESEMWSRKGLELFRSNGDLLAGRAQALCRMNDLKQAHAMCDGALNQSGQTAYRWLVRGEVLLAGRQDTARHCFDKALQLDGDWLVPLEIALVHVHYRVPSRALIHVRRAVEGAPDCYYAWYVQGTCQFELGFSGQARRSFERCLELCPGHLDAERQLSEGYRVGGTFLRRIRRLFGRS